MWYYLTCKEYYYLTGVSKCNITWLAKCNITWLSPLSSSLTASVSSVLCKVSEQSLLVLVSRLIMGDFPCLYRQITTCTHSIVLVLSTYHYLYYTGQEYHTEYEGDDTGDGDASSRYHQGWYCTGRDSIRQGSICGEHYYWSRWLSCSPVSLHVLLSLSSCR